MSENNENKASRGSVSQIILSALYSGDKYGYEICKEIEALSNGELVLKQPSLYSSLRRMEVQGLIESYWEDSSLGGKRHYYSLTESGKLLVEKNKQEWQVDNLINKLPNSSEDNLKKITDINNNLGHISSKNLGNREKEFESPLKNTNTTNQKDKLNYSNNTYYNATTTVANQENLFYLAKKQQEESSFQQQNDEIENSNFEQFGFFNSVEDTMKNDDKIQNDANLKTSSFNDDSPSLTNTPKSYESSINQDISEFKEEITNNKVENVEYKHKLFDDNFISRNEVYTNNDESTNDLLNSLSQMENPFSAKNNNTSSADDRNKNNNIFNNNAEAPNCEFESSNDTNQLGSLDEKANGINENLFATTYKEPLLFTSDEHTNQNVNDDTTNNLGLKSSETPEEIVSMGLSNIDNEAQITEISDAKWLPKQCNDVSNTLDETNDYQMVIGQLYNDSKLNDPYEQNKYRNFREIFPSTQVVEESSNENEGEIASYIKENSIESHQMEDLSLLNNMYAYQGVKIKKHDSTANKKNTRKYTDVNKLNMLTGWITALIMFLEVLICNILLNKSGNISSSQYFIYFLGYATSFCIAIVTTLENFFDRFKLLIISPNFKKSFVIKLLIFIFSVIFIFIFALIFGVRNLWQAKSISYWLIPVLMATNLIISHIVYVILYKSKSFNY